MTSPEPTAAARDQLPWWLPAVLVCVMGLGVSFAQPSCATGRDIRFEAARCLFDGQRTYVGDPWPSVVAAGRLAANRRARVYDADLSVGSAFIYPPLAALLYEPLARLPPQQARHELMIANHVLFVGIFLVLLRVLCAGRPLRWQQVAAVVAALGLFYPLLHAVELNQAMVLVTLLLGAAWIALQERRDALAGCLIALTFAIKPQLVLVLPLLGWHARRTVVAALATAAALLAASLAYAGVQNHLDYATGVLATLSRGYGYYANQSLNGLFNRVFIDVRLGFFELPPRSGAVQGLTLLAGLATYAGALALVRRWRGRDGLGPWVLGLAWLVATLVSPVSWQHHYAPALFVFALLARAVSERPEIRTQRLLVPAASSFALMAGYFEVRQLQGALERVAVSYLLFGALALAVALVLVIETPPADRTDRPAGW
jgi:hypothetical protein